MITTQNLREAFNRMGRTSIRSSDIDEIIRTHAETNGDEITFEDFKAIFGQFDADKL